MTPKPNGLRTPGEKTPQGLKTRANKATKLRILLYEPLLGVNTYALLGTNTQLNQRIIYIYIYFSNLSNHLSHKYQGLLRPKHLANQ